jgi:hypothetical protein
MLFQRAASDVFQGFNDVLDDISKQVPKSHEPNFTATLSFPLIYVKFIYCSRLNKFESVAMTVDVCRIAVDGCACEMLTPPFVQQISPRRCKSRSLAARKWVWDYNAPKNDPS